MNPLSKLEALLAALLVIGAETWYYTAHERKIGAEKCLSDTAAAVQKVVEQNLVTHTRQVDEVAQESKDYAQATANIVNAPVISVCKPPSPRAVPRTGSAPAKSDEDTRVRASDTQLPPTEWDTQPIVQAGHDADAQVITLQRYIKNVCLKGKEES